MPSFRRYRTAVIPQWDPEGKHREGEKIEAALQELLSAHDGTILHSVNQHGYDLLVIYSYPDYYEDRPEVKEL